MLDKESRTPIASNAMKSFLKENGITTEKTVVYYCTGGVRSAWAWMTHTIAGLPPAINMEGGYEEWTRTR